MYRDFSLISKQKLFNLVSQVENEKYNNFTDWIGDRWLDFETWIGKLNIKNYINDVNAYHKKVIDKNNTTKNQIEKIFNSVYSIDRNYKSTFSILYSALDQWQIYIKEMEQIIDPQNGKFNAEYMAGRLSGTLNSCNQATVEAVKTAENYTNTQDNSEMPFDPMEVSPVVLKLLSKLSNQKDQKADLQLSSSTLSYLSGLWTFVGTDYNSNEELASGGLKFAKSSASAWNGLYNYYDSKLSPLEASRLSKRLGKANNYVSIIGNACGFTAESIETVRTLFNEDADLYQKADQVLSEVNSGISLGKAAVNVKFAQKHLYRSVTAKYEWRASYSGQATVKKINSFANLSIVGIDTIRGTMSKAAELSEDGSFGFSDIGESGLYGSVRGLTSVASCLTLGLSDVLGLSDKADDISAGIVHFTETTGADYVRSHAFSSAYVRGAQGLMDYADDESNNFVLRIGASALAGAGMITSVAIDGVGDACSFIGKTASSAAKGIGSACSAVGKWISDGWKNIFG